MTEHEPAEAELSGPESITTREGLVDFYATASYFNSPAASELIDLETERELIRRHHPVDGLLQRAQEGKDLYLVFRDQQKRIVATGNALITEDPAEALFSSASVAPDLRGQKVMSRLFKAREAWAREKKCQRIVAEIKMTNIRSLNHVFKNGMQLTGLKDAARYRVSFDDRPAFVKQSVAEVATFFLHKDISAKDQAPQKAVAALRQEVPLADLGTIKRLLDHGWVGVGLKPLTERADLSVENWLLELEQKRQ